jgi:hypothetical protein
VGKRTIALGHIHSLSFNFFKGCVSLSLRKFFRYPLVRHYIELRFRPICSKSRPIAVFYIIFLYKTKFLCMFSASVIWILCVVYG